MTPVLDSLGDPVGYVAAAFPFSNPEAKIEPCAERAGGDAVAVVDDACVHDLRHKRAQFVVCVPVRRGMPSGE